LIHWSCIRLVLVNVVVKHDGYYARGAKVLI